MNCFRTLSPSWCTLTGDKEDGLWIVTQLPYENANAVCWSVLSLFRKRGDISDYIQIWSDFIPLYTQGLAMAVAFQGKTVKNVLSHQGNQGPERRTVWFPASYFGCDQMRQWIRQYPVRWVSLGARREPGPCRRYKMQELESTGLMNAGQRRLLRGIPFVGKEQRAHPRPPNRFLR